jgi:hypothetical protein
MGTYKIRLTATVDEVLKIEAETEEDAFRVAYAQSLDSIKIQSLEAELVDEPETDDNQEVSE